MTQPGLHENLEREEEIAGSTDRGFGLAFSIVFSVVGLLPLLGGRSPRLWAIALAATFLGVALLVPALLSPLNRVWLKVGLVLHKVVSPVAMGLIFFLVIVPVALVMKLIRRDALHRKPDVSIASYWVPRQSPGTDAAAMRNQF